MGNINKPKDIVRVVLEYDDGTVEEVTGAAAKKWQESCDIAFSWAFAHGVRFEPIDWKFVVGRR